MGLSRRGCGEAGAPGARSDARSLRRVGARGKSVALEQLAEELGCSIDDLRTALESVIEVEDRDLTTISGVLIGDRRRVKYLQGGYEREFRKPMRLSPVQGRTPGPGPRLEGRG